MIIFSGSSNEKLAKDICSILGGELGQIDIGKFSDGEIQIKIKDTIRGKEIFLIQSTSDPVNDNLMELLIIIDALKRASAGKINVVMPYYGYARQDRKSSGREPITAKLVADLIQRAGAQRLLAVDLHAGQIQGYFDIPVDHFQGGRLLARYFIDMVDENPDEWVVVSPDLGGVTRARSFANYLKLPIAIIEKIRPRPNVSAVVNLIGDIEEKNCIIIDDIIDTAGTITNAVGYIKEKGAKDVYITATHGVLSGPAVSRIENSLAKKCVVTDSIALPEEKYSEKIDVVSIAPLLAEAIDRIYNNESVSGLFLR